MRKPSRMVQVDPESSDGVLIKEEQKRWDADKRREGGGEVM